MRKTIKHFGTADEQLDAQVGNLRKQLKGSHFYALVGFYVGSETKVLCLTGGMSEAEMVLLANCAEEVIASILERVLAERAKSQNAEEKTH